MESINSLEHKLLKSDDIFGWKFDNFLSGHYKTGIDKNNYMVSVQVKASKEVYIWRW